MKLSKNLISNSLREAQFIGSSKTSRCRPSQQSGLLAVDRSVDRPTVRFLTVGPAVDRSVDRGLDTESRSSLPVNRPVGRGQIQRAELSGGRPGRSTGPPAKQGVHVLCTSVDHPVDRPIARLTVQSTGRSQNSIFLGIKSLSFFLQ